MLAVSVRILSSGLAICNGLYSAFPKKDSSVQRLSECLSVR